MEFFMTYIMGPIGVLLLCLFVADSLGFFAKWKKKPMGPVPSMAFGTDIEFLHFLIDHEIKMVKVYLMDPSRLAGSGIINDKAFSEYSDDIIERVILSLSPTYRAVLSKYFKWEMLVEYVSSVVLREMTAVSLQNNLNSMKQTGRKPPIMKV